MHSAAYMRSPYVLLCAPAPITCNANGTTSTAVRMSLRERTRPAKIEAFIQKECVMKSATILTIGLVSGMQSSTPRSTRGVMTCATVTSKKTGQ